MSRRRSRVAVAGVVAAVVALAGGAFLRARAVDPSTSAGEARPVTRFRFDITPGTRVDYDFRLASDQRLSRRAAPGTPEVTEASLRLAGGLSLRAYERRGDTLRIGVLFTRIDDASLRMLGADALASVDGARAELVDREALVDMTTHGKVEAIGVRRDDPDTFKSLVHAVVQAFAVTAPGDASATWTAEERAMLGRAVSTYTTLPGDGARWERSRGAYAALAAAPAGAPTGLAVKDVTTVHLALEGHLLAIDTHEELTAMQPELRATVDFAMTRTSVGTFDDRSLVARADTLERREPGQSLSPEDVQRRLLEQTAGDITMDEITRRVGALAGGASLEDGWMTRAVAFLGLHPEHYGTLLRVFEERDAGSRARGYVLDLLRSVGTKEAQATMRSALASAAARAVPGEYPALLQRLSLLQRPEAETVAFARAALDGARDEHERRAALFTLGSTAGARLRTASDARAHVERVAAELARATTEEDRKAAVAALGNAGTDDAPRLLAPHAMDPSSGVRAEVATALRKVKTPEARQLLTSLVGDRDGTVARAALRTLEEQPLARGELARITDAITSGAFASGADPSVLGLASRHMDDRELAERMFRAVVARNANAPKVQARARMLLEQLGGGGT